MHEPLLSRGRQHGETGFYSGAPVCPQAACRGLPVDRIEKCRDLIPVRLHAHAAECRTNFLMTHRRLHNRFRFDEQHEVEIKGKGRMQVFHLIGPVDASARQATA